MKELIDVVNKLQDVFHISGCKGIDLPQVVVLGTQSSGKSSVLEHLVGKSFLPRGTGVVTRCPLILQMTRVSTNEYAIFQHNTGKVFTDYSLICEEIEAQTEILAGSNKGICNTPIILKLHSPNFIDLTLVDLPGLTKVPVGDQPYDIEEQTRGLIMEYVENPNSIILAVTPANTDMATSDSLKISRDVDPEGKRTLAVVTKLDIMDDGTNANDMLNGQIIPVKLGIVGVVNRSQKDITEGKSIKDSLIDEAAFFERKYNTIAAQHGTAYLTKTVQKILMNHIKTCLPGIKEKIKQQLLIHRADLQCIGDGKLDRPAKLLELLTKFSNLYCSTIIGNLSNIETTELCGGARINYVFQQTFYSALESIDALEGLSNSQILTALQNATGVSPVLFVPEIAFQLLVKKQIRQMRGPCIQCVDLIHEELNKITESCLLNPDLGLLRFPKLQQEIEDTVSEVLSTRVPVAKEMIDHLVDVQLAYIYTSNPNFMANQAVRDVDDDNDDNVESTKQNKSMVSMKKQYQSLIKSWLKEPKLLSSSSENKEKTIGDCVLIQELIKNYFSIVKMSIQDTVPKMIMHFLVNYIMDHLQSQLLEKLYGSNAEALLQESSEVTEKRSRLVKVISALEKATQVLNALNSYHGLSKQCSKQYVPSYSQAVKN